MEGYLSFVCIQMHWIYCVFASALLENMHIIFNLSEEETDAEH